MDRESLESMGEAGEGAAEREFRNPHNIAGRVILSLGAGVLFLLLLGIHFFLMLLSPNTKGSAMLPAVSSGLGVMAIFGIGYAIYLLRCPKRVITGTEGMRVEWLIKQGYWRWEEIAEVRDNKVTVLGGFFGGGRKASTEREVLEIYDRRGKLLAKLTDELEDFGKLAEQIREYSSQAQGHSTYDAAAEAQRKEVRTRKSLRWAGVFGLFLMMLSLALGIAFYQELKVNQMLEREGERIQAKVLRHYIYNVTPRLEYEYTDGQGNRYQEDVMMNRRSWDLLGEQPTVEIIYVPSEPEHSRLVEGQEEESLNLPPALQIVLVAAAFGFGAILLGCWRLGISDIKIEGGKIRIVRIGQVLQEAGLVAAESANTWPASGVGPEAAAASRKTTAAKETAMVNMKPRELPGGLQAIAILNGIFGGLGVLVNITRLFLLLVLVLMGRETIAMGPVQVVIDTGLGAFANGIVLLLAGGLMISVFGLWRRKNWGRWMALWASAGLILAAVIEIIIIVQGMGNIEGLNEQERFGVQIGMAAAIFVKLLVMAYPVVVLVVLGRRSAKEIFGTKHPKYALADYQ